MNKKACFRSYWRSVSGDLLSPLAFLVLGAFIYHQTLATPVVPNADSEPQFTQTVRIQFEFYKTQQEVMKRCGWTSPINGCELGVAQHGVAGLSVIVVMTPSNWCDFKRIQTIGHEAMHSIGWRHSKRHIVPPSSEYDSLNTWAREKDPACEWKRPGDHDNG